MKPESPSHGDYRGRLAPSPTGHLHLGHARTFWRAQERARAHRGILVLRVEDLDRSRCRPEFEDALYEDLAWFGFAWQEGPRVGGPHAPYRQSERLRLYRTALGRLREGGWVYPCSCSRRDIQNALSAPHAGDEEPLYPGTCRNRNPESAGSRVSWRFRVPDGERVAYVDLNLGRQTFVAGRDFGDFVVWRGDDLPSYQLACVIDDAAMRISEVVRGADLVLSTARQLLLYGALDLIVPRFLHCELMTDERGQRLAKRHEALSLRRLREGGAEPADLRKDW